MRVAISGLAAAAALFSSCHATGVAEDARQDAPPLAMGGRAGAERPLSPSILEFRHVESQNPGTPIRTFIQTVNGDRWTRTFGNVTFGWGDPYVTGLVGEQSLPARTVVRSQLVRLDSPRAVFNAIREYSADLSIPDLAPAGRAYVFLFPKRADYEQTLREAGTAAIPALQPFAGLTPQCSYARLRLDQGNRQAAILFMHVPDLTVSMEDGSDRACVEQFFAKNLVLTPSQVHALIYPAGTATSGACTVARMLRPENRQAEPAIETAGCPIAPNRRAEVLVAFAKALGVGLKPLEAHRIIESTRNTCEQQLQSDVIKDESCRSVVRGEK